MRRCVVLLGLLACGKHEPEQATGSAAGSATTSAVPADADQPGCQPLPFEASTPVPEASAAAWIEIEGKPVLVVVGDSGNKGAYGIVDAETGTTIEQGTLPLGAPGDDIEGLASHAGKLYGLTSSGWMRVWQRKKEAAGFDLVDGPYPIAQLPDLMVCGRSDVNCGLNYEGLALDPRAKAPERCIGFACSKGQGRMYCLVNKGGKLQLEKSLAIAVDRTGVVADCAFSPEGDLYAANNIFGMGNVFRIDGWSDPAHAKITLVDSPSVGFPEVVAVRGDLVYRMSDTGGAPSLMGKFRCTPSTR
ncbi:MAG TPA: hypothetical protein VLB44_06940 [Kofleriaceae bacterium]|nr:hypothetical protein [Kofleriaceae bacterium]